jgi:hypothetical protein
MKNIVRISACLASTVLLGLSGCGDQGTASNSSTSAATVTPSWLINDRPSEWLEIGSAKQTVEAGQTVTLRGRIGGRDNPISSESAAFVMVDVSIPSCADIEGDNCPKPWDYCCEPRESLAANIATVIVLDEDGTHTRVNLNDAGLSPLDEVMVTGTVDARPNQNVLTIRATSVHKVARSD